MYIESSVLICTTNIDWHASWKYRE